MLSDLQNSQAQNYSQGGIRFGALIAAVVKGGEHCLIEYGTADFQPEFKEDKLFYVSTGSGQSLADPFLAFVDRVLWNNTMPTVELGKLGVMWVLQHTIRFAPGGVGGSPSMAILKRVDGRWIASKLTIDELQESAQYTNQLEEHIKGFALGGIQNAETAALPIPPAQNA
jgi:hypothetical protein